MTDGSRVLWRMDGGGFVDCLDVDGGGGYGGDWCDQFDNDVTLRCYQ